MNHSKGSNFSGDVFYENIYKMNPSKIIGIQISLINVLFFTPLFYAIIWFEKYGSNTHRTLLNQLVATSCWHIIGYNLIGQTSEMALAICGPFHHWFCHGQILLKNISNCQQINLLLAMIVTKYLSIFVLKNPTGINCEFWNTFITSSSFLGILIL